MSNKKTECFVQNAPKTVAKETLGEFTFEINDWGDLSVSNKYEPTTFVFESAIVDVLLAKLNKLHSIRKDKIMEDMTTVEENQRGRIECLEDILKRIYEQLEAGGVIIKDEDIYVEVAVVCGCQDEEVLERMKAINQAKERNQIGG